MEDVIWHLSTDTVTTYDLDEIEKNLTLEQIHAMNRRMKDVVGNMIFKDIKDRALAEMIFKLGYLSTCTKYQERT